MTEDAKIPPKPNKETLYVDVDDEITGIIEKVDAASGKVVALVLPKRATMLKSIVNMRLLKRSADSAGKNVVLITSEHSLLPLAGAAGLHVAKNLQSKPEVPAGPDSTNAVPAPDEGLGVLPITGDQAVEDPDNMPAKFSYDKPIGALADAHEARHPETIEIGEPEDDAAAAEATEKLPKAPKNKSLSIPNFDKFRLWMGLGVAGFIALIIFVILAIFVLPKATITIQTTSTPVSANFSLTTNGSAAAFDASKNVIPAISKTSDQTSTQQATATGQQNNGNKTSGNLVMRTADCSGLLPSGVAAGTGTSSAGLTFITQAKATFVPTTDSSGHCYYTSGNVGVIAQQGGAKYNLAAGSDFSVAGYSGITGSNGTAFSGGTDNIQTILSQSDVDSAKAKLTSTDTDTFSKKFQSDLDNQGFYVLTSTLNQADPVVTSSPAVGQAATTASVSIKITYTVMVVKQTDLKAAINNALKNQIDETKQKVDDSNILKDLTLSVTGASSPTDATLNLTENTTAVPIINTAAIQKQSAGKKSGDISANITPITGVKNVNVKFSPFWVSKAPGSPSKVKVILQPVGH